MTRFENEVEEEIKKQRIINHKRAEDDIRKRDPEILKKIENYCISHGFSYNEDFIKKVEEDKVILYFFAVDPYKQNVPEKIFLNYTKHIGIIKLSNNGKDSLYVYNGNVIDFKDKKNLSKQNKDITKSIDFKLEKNGKKYYLCNKYTRISGGAQDNQKEDGLSFIHNSKSNTDINNKFIFICDGEYYTTRLLEEIRNSLVGFDNVMIMKTDEFLEYIGNV